MHGEAKTQHNKICIGHTTFYVTSKFLGDAELSYLMKRLIRQDMA